MIITDESLLRLPTSLALDDEIPEILNQLESELNNCKMSGIGLAAPQIGIYKQVAIVRLTNLKIDLVNSKISNMTDGIIFRSEGCLSFPGRVEDTYRYQSITLTNNGVISQLQGLQAIVVQHEIDHWNSKLFFDYKIPSKINRNDLCYCGSGKKFKRCHYGNI